MILFFWGGGNFEFFCSGGGNFSPEMPRINTGVGMFFRGAVCMWRKRHACPAADNGADMTCLEAHFALKSGCSRHDSYV